MSVNSENKSYRKGLVLGLTMAEIAILIIFILLLTFAALLKEEQDKAQLIEKNKASLEKIIQIIDKEEPDLTQELILAIEKLPEILSLIKKEELKKDNDETSSQVIERAIEKLKLEKELDGASAEEKLKEAMKDKADLESKIANLEGQNKNLIKQCKGVGFPPCWADSAGSPEYIYDLDLKDDGITIHDNKLPNRAEEQAKLNISGVKYDEPLKMSDFSQQTHPLLKYGQEHECRFYVRIYDKTGNDKKELYKNLRQTVEGNFYILKKD